MKLRIEKAKWKMELLKNNNMRKYLGKVQLQEKHSTMSSGAIAEEIFELWFKNVFQGELIFKQKADQDFKGIDFADEKGVTYQIKGSIGKTFTFNCVLDNLDNHLKADNYVFIQVHKDCAYIESIYNKEEIKSLANSSYNYKNTCFVWAKDLQQYELNF